MTNQTPNQVPDPAFDSLPDERSGARRAVLRWGVLVVAFVLCGIAWARFFQVVISNPSPVRYIVFADETGTRETFEQRCAGPAFVQRDVVWRYCDYDPADTQTSRWGLVRFDLPNNRAGLLWPVAHGADVQILALAAAPGGDLAVVWGGQQVTDVSIARLTGGVQSLGVPGDAVQTVMGFAWRGDRLEMVWDGPAGVQIAAHNGEAWDAPRRVMLPDGCGETNVCALQMAYVQTDDWRFLVTRAPQIIDDPAAAAIELVVTDDGGEPLLTDQMALSAVDPSYYTLEADGRISRIGRFFDCTPGNVINWWVDRAPMILREGAYQPMEPPPVGDTVSFYFSNYEIQGDRLRWIPGIRFPVRGWQIGRWMALQTAGDDLVLDPLAAETGPALAQAPAFMTREMSQTVVLPASNGGYWVLGANGAYLKADSTMARADALTIWERVRRVFANFGSLQDYSGAFYRQRAELKMLALPLVLLALPVGYLLVFFVRQTRRDRRAWVRLLVMVSAGYLVVALIFIWWFWETLRRF